jgi:tetratricopeptide (TPR) repeat protein
MEAENTWVIFGWLLLNRWRYEYRNWNFDEAERYFIQLLELPMNAFIRSEVYFNLSSIYLNKQDEESVRQGIEYAKQWIEAQADYPFNHTNLWIGYLYAGELDNVLEPLQRALQLHPLSVQTAKFLWIYYYTVDDFENAIASFKLQLENADKDITLMKDEREAFRQQAIYDIARSYAWAWDAVNSISYLDMLLWTWENGSYYIQFLMDHALWGVFVNISETGLFQEALQRYAELYRDSDFNS